MLYIKVLDWIKFSTYVNLRIGERCRYANILGCNSAVGFITCMEYTNRVEKRVSERVLPRDMHIIQSETLGETRREREKSCQESRQKSHQESRRKSRIICMILGKTLSETRFSDWFGMNFNPQLPLGRMFLILRRDLVVASLFPRFIAVTRSIFFVQTQM